MRKIPLLAHLARGTLLVAGVFSSSLATQAAVATNWVAYHEHRPTEGVTHPNASGFDIRVTGDGGLLKDFSTGQNLPVRVDVASTGTSDPDDFGANAYPDPDTPAFRLFDGILDVGNSGTIGVRSSAGSTVRLTFKNLDPSKRYTFAGTSARGGNYADRWAMFTLGGAVGAVAAHEIGTPVNLITKATFPTAPLNDNQVALNSGHNVQGSLVVWRDIDPGDDGEFSILAEHYTGPNPMNAAATGPYGYGFTAFYLAEVGEVLPIAITAHPVASTNAPGQNITFSVTTSGSGISYQWQKANPGSTTFANIPNATSATYSPGTATAADDGAQFRVIVSGQGNTLTSRAALLTVRGAPIEIPGLLKMEIYKNIATTFIDELLNSPNYPNNPDEVVALAGFDTRTALPTDALNNYGAVISGFIIPPQNGDYDFMLRSDDQGQLYLSSNESFDNMTLIAEETGCCGPFEEPGLSGRTTFAPISLVAGRKYAVRAFLKEGGGGDYLQVAWRRVGDSTPAGLLTPISPAYVSGMFPAQGVIEITQQPGNRTAAQNDRINLSIGANSLRTPLLIQWQRNGVTIPGLVGSDVVYGPLAQGDNGARFRAVLSVPGATVTSSEATVTVTTDVTPPSIASVVGSETFNSITVEFSEAVTAASAGQAGNYTLDKGLTISGVQVLSPTRVRLTTSAQTPATVYTLGIRGIVDTAGVTSAANASASFSSFAILRGGLKFEAWNGLTGTPIINLTEDPKYQQPADVVGYITSVNTRSIYPDDSHENYGARISAWLVPAESGSYDFMLRSDDSGQLYLSTDDKVENLQLIAEETGCCGAFEEPGISARTTQVPVDLVAGRRYYFQVLYKEGGGGDYAQVAWRKVGDSTPAGTLTPMPGSLFEIIAMPGSLTAPTVVFTNPQNGDVIAEGTPIQVTVNPGAAEGKTITRVEIFRGSTRIADLSSGPYTVTVTGLTADVYTFTARATDSAGLIATTAPLNISVGQRREVVNLVLMDDVTTWRYDRSGQDLGTEWREMNYNDSTWPEGKALIADESGATVVPIRTPISRFNDAGEYVKTFYFRTRFQWTGPTTDVRLSLRHVIDDGAVVYLNGVEVHRFGITAGVVVDATTDAASHEQAFEGPFVIDAALLRQGLNVLAVEVHQNGGSSSDVVFGAELTASVPVSGPTEPPEFTRVQRNGSNLTLEWRNGRLQSRSAFGTGTWADVPNAQSPFNAPAGSGNMFFRVAQ